MIVIKGLGQPITLHPPYSCVCGRDSNTEVSSSTAIFPSLKANTETEGNVLVASETRRSGFLCAPRIGGIWRLAHPFNANTGATIRERLQQQLRSANDSASLKALADQDQATVQSTGSNWVHRGEGRGGER